MFIIAIAVWVFVCMSVCAPWRPVEGLRGHGTEVTAGCKLPCGCWDWTWGLWKGSSALSLVTTSPVTTNVLHAYYKTNVSNTKGTEGWAHPPLHTLVLWQSYCHHFLRYAFDRFLFVLAYVWFLLLSFPDTPLPPFPWHSVGRVDLAHNPGVGGGPSWGQLVSFFLVRFMAWLDVSLESSSLPEKPMCRRMGPKQVRAKSR